MTSSAPSRSPGGTERRQRLVDLRATSFVGRRQQMSEIRAALGTSRLVSLTGAGGVGKTRLAVEVMRDVARLYADGAWFVELDSISEDSEVASAVVRALGISDQSARAPLQKIVDYVFEREMLIVLDNCEHVLGGVATVVDAMLRSAARVRIMATSRISLGITEERLCCVPHLSIPPEGDEHTAGGLEQYESIRLLIERAEAAAPEFVLTDRNAAAAAELCIRLEGSPLAIELAVARLRTLTLPELVARLSDRFSLLTKGSRLAAPRQQTLRAMIDWSYALCTPGQRRLWARLSVFVGGFDLTAAEGVGDPDEDLGDEDILDLLGQLIDQSLLHVDARGPTRRFRMLETIREYGAERLALRGETDTLRSRHCDYYLSLAESSAASWCGPGQDETVAWLRVEHSNLRAAMEWCAATADVDTGLKLFGALRFRWYADGHIAEGRRWADEILDRAGTRPEPTEARARALWVAAWVCLLQGERRVAERRVAECEQIAEAVGDPVARAYVWKLRGLSALFAGELDVAVDNYRVAVGRLRDCGELPGYLSAAFQYALALTLSGASGNSREVTAAALAVCETHGERWDRSYVQWVRALDMWLHGDHDSAAALAREALSLHAVFNHSVGTALMTELLAWIAESYGRPERSAELIGAAGALWERSGTAISAFGPGLSGLHAQCERKLRDAMPAEAFRNSVRGGAARSHPQIIDHALADDESGGEVAEAFTSDSSPVELRDQRNTPADSPLTSRQTEIAALVAQGMSNKQIASRLVVSVRTVDSHVERSLVRLGFHSRTQLAAWYTRATDPGGGEGLQ